MASLQHAAGPVHRWPLRTSPALRLTLGSSSPPKVPSLIIPILHHGVRGSSPDPRRVIPRSYCPLLPGHPLAAQQRSDPAFTRPAVRRKSSMMDPPWPAASDLAAAVHLLLQVPSVTASSASPAPPEVMQLLLGRAKSLHCTGEGSLSSLTSPPSGGWWCSRPPQALMTAGSSRHIGPVPAQPCRDRHFVSGRARPTIFGGGRSAVGACRHCAPGGGCVVVVVTQVWTAPPWSYGL